MARSKDEPITAAMVALWVTQFPSAKSIPLKPTDYPWPNDYLKKTNG